MMNKVTVKDMVDRLGLEVVCGNEGLSKVLSSKMLSRPGLELAGLFDFYEEDRIQIIGSKERTFFDGLNEMEKIERSEKLFRKKTPAFVFSNNFTVPEVFIRNAEKYGIVILRSNKNTTPLMNDVTSYLYEALAEMTSMHGVLVDIHGVGVLIRGKSGIGKSEAALELVKRGHQLIADDHVIIYEKEPGRITGKPPKILERVMEIRGIGIINVVQMFGAGAFRHKKEISLVCDLELHETDTSYDRIGIDETTIKILNTEVPFIKIPIRPGRNMASLIEVAAVNRRLRYMGYNAAEEFVSNLTELIDENKERKTKDGGK